MANDSFSVSLGGEQTRREMDKVSNAETNSTTNIKGEKSFLDPLVDAWAGSSPLGAGVAGLLNTPGNQLYYSDIDRRLQENKEYMENADTRNEERKMLLARTAEESRALQLGNEKREWELDTLDNAEAQNYFNGLVKANSAAFQNDMSGNPIYSGWSLEQRESFNNSPSVKAANELATILQMVQSAFSGNEKDAKRLGYLMSINGYKQEVSEDGKTMVIITPDGKRYNANGETINTLKQDAGRLVTDEFKAIQSVSQGLASGNANLMGQAETIQRLSRYNGSTAASERAVNEVLANLKKNGADEYDRNMAIYTLANTYKYIKEGKLPAQQLAIVIGNSQDALKFLGYECKDPANPMGNYIKNYPNGTSEEITLDQLGQRVMNSDVIGKQFEVIEENARLSNEREMERQRNLEYERELAFIKAASEQMDGKGSGGEEKPLVLTESETQEMGKQYGTDFYKLDDDKRYGIKKVEQDVMSDALGKGYIEILKDGSIKVKSDLTDATINEMCGVENAIFEARGYEDLSKSGFWHYVKKERDAKKGQEKAKNKESDVKNADEARRELHGVAASIPNSIPSAVAKTGIYQAADDYYLANRMIQAVSNLFNGTKEENERREEKAKKVLTGSN